MENRIKQAQKDFNAMIKNSSKKELEKIKNSAYAIGAVMFAKRYANAEKENVVYKKIYNIYYNYFENLTNSKMKNNWEKYSPHFLDKGSNCFYQKLILQVGEEKVYADIIEWEIENEKSYTLKIQIPKEVSITGMTINVENFNYKELDFDIIEKYAKKIIKSLTNPKEK